MHILVTFGISLTLQICVQLQATDVKSLKRTRTNLGANLYVCMYYNHGRSTVGVAITAQSTDQV